MKKLTIIVAILICCGLYAMVKLGGQKADNSAGQVEIEKSVGDIAKPDISTSFDSSNSKPKSSEVASPKIETSQQEEQQMNNHLVKASQKPSASVSEATAEAISQAVRKIQESIKNKDSETLWKLVTKNYKDTYSSGGYEEFKEKMDERYIKMLMTGFFDLQVKSIIQQDGFLRLNAKSNVTAFVIDFMQENGQWKMNNARCLPNND